MHATTPGARCEQGAARKIYTHRWNGGAVYFKQFYEISSRTSSNLVREPEAIDFCSPHNRGFDASAVFALTKGCLLFEFAAYLLHQHILFVFRRVVGGLCTDHPCPITSPLHHVEPRTGSRCFSGRKGSKEADSQLGMGAFAGPPA